MMNNNKKPFDLYISSHVNESSATAIGIKEGDFSELLKNLEEHASFLSNACICASSCKTILNVLKETEIHYKTEEAQYCGNILCVHDTQKFKEICDCKKQTIQEVWLTVIREISWDIDECVERYGDESIGNFLTNLLVYITQFTIVTKQE